MQKRIGRRNKKERWREKNGAQFIMNQKAEEIGGRTSLELNQQNIQRILHTSIVLTNKLPEETIPVRPSKRGQ